jgi:hypothetical protein
MAAAGVCVHVPALLHRQLCDHICGIHCCIDGSDGCISSTVKP